MRAIAGLIVVAVSLLIFSGAAWSGAPDKKTTPPRSVDVSNFDVAGVKTGMDYNEAVEAAAKYFKIDPCLIKPGGGILVNTNHSRSFSYEKDEAVLTVDLITRIPVDKKRPGVVYKVSFKMPQSRENAAAMKKAALTKYGEPSGEGMVGAIMWCANPVFAANGKNVSCREQAALMLTFAYLELRDPSWEKAAAASVTDSFKKNK